MFIISQSGPGCSFCQIELDCTFCQIGPDWHYGQSGPGWTDIRFVRLVFHLGRQFGSDARRD